MAISREAKETQVKALSAKFAKSELTVLADYTGLSVAEMQELRALLKAEDASFQIAKNSLIKLAAANTSALASMDMNLFDGPTALGFGYGDEVTVAQVLARFGKTHTALQLKAAITADGQVLDAVAVNQLALLPSRDQLLGQLVGTLAAPISGFVRVLGGNLTGLMNVINQIKEAKA